MNNGLVDHDERTVAVENAGYRWAYLFTSFGLLAIVAFRGFIKREASWDLLALVILGGLVHAVFRAFHGALYRRLALRIAVAVVAAAVLASVLVFARR